MESAPAEMKRVLVYGGKTGWIGGLMVELCKKEGRINKCLFDSTKMHFADFFFALVGLIVS